ncbi:hypothetical protein K502DRAFT_363708 [Neoconidiobolus thromboides FSU 785]|nr:hypothetical protein K502DRAFT_363708 [Neoconidiobolus thromboides FSU 785]
MFFRPIVRSLPQKTASNLHSGQFGLSTFINSQQSSYNNPNNPPHQYYNQHNLTYYQDYTPNNSRRYATLNDSYLSNNLNQSFRPYITPFTEDHLDLESLSNEEYDDFIARIDEEVHYCATKGLRLDHCLTQVKYIKSRRLSNYMDAVVLACYKYSLTNEAENFITDIYNEHGIVPGQNSYYVLMKICADRSSWDELFKWLDICINKGKLNFAWDEILTKLIKADQQNVHRSMKLFRSIYSYSEPKLSINTVNMVAEAYRIDKRKDTMEALLKAVAQIKEQVPISLTTSVLDAINEVNGFETGLYSLKCVFKNNTKFSKRFKSDIIRYYSHQSSNFDEFYYIYTFSQRNDIPEMFLDSLVQCFLKQLKAVRNDLSSYKQLIDLPFIQFFLRKLVRHKFEPTYVIEVIQVMKELGLKGREEFKTIIDLFQLNLSLNHKLSLAEKEGYKIKVNLLLPYVTTGSVGISSENSLETQAANHRVLQSQDPHSCSKEIKNMLSNFLRPSSVAITHTLARFMHIRQYEEGYALFKYSLPSLKSIAKETGFISACGPVYNFAIRLCCRIPLVTDAKKLVEELEANGGYLDPFASAELIMLLKKTSGHEEAIKSGLALLNVLQHKGSNIPAFFFNVLFNTMIDAGQHKQVWELLNTYMAINFNPTAITYGVLIKASLRDNDYQRAIECLHKSIDSKVLIAGPSMPIFCQLLEYTLSTSRSQVEAHRLINLAHSLRLKTNPRFNLFKLRAMTELMPLQLDALIPTLKKQNEFSSIPISHYQIVLANLIKVEEYKMAFEVIKMMRGNGVIPEVEMYQKVVDGLQFKKDLGAVNEAMRLLQTSYSNLPLS